MNYFYLLKAITLKTSQNKMAFTRAKPVSDENMGLEKALSGKLCNWLISASTSVLRQ